MNNSSFDPANQSNRSSQPPSHQGRPTPQGGSSPMSGQPRYGAQPPYDQQQGQWGGQNYPHHGNPHQQWSSPQPPPKKNFFLRHKILTGLLALVLIVIVGSAVSQGGKGSSSADGDSSGASGGGTGAASGHASQSDGKKDKKDALPPIGTPVRDGKFEFTVTRVERNVPSVGDQYLNQKAQGAYTLVYVSVKNVSTETQAMSADSQKAYDTHGVGYSADSTASLYMEGNDMFFKDVNPGNTLKGVLVFDAAKGTKLTKVRLHDSMFSNGVEASL